ncbi:MAG: hypothetical protein ABSH29_16500 [Acidimicrobiales bacterium]
MKTPASGQGMAEAAPILQVELDVQGPTCLLTLRGVLCGGSLAALAAQVDQLGCLPCERVVVDMCQVTQLDQAGARSFSACTTTSSAGVAHCASPGWRARWRIPCAPRARSYCQRADSPDTRGNQVFLFVVFGVGAG